jgi:hypothetical protein
VRSLSYDAAVAAIDASNSDDPNLIDVRGERLPLALAHGRLATDWVLHLQPDASELVLLAARAHHLRRWELARTTYPEGRAGYLRWRRDQKARHARDIEAILRGVGYDADDTARVQAMLRREGLGTDPDTQLVEDAACLVFVETQLGPVAEQLGFEHTIEVLQKTARKMSPAAIAALTDVPLSESDRAILTAAFG